jgi:two-component system response regulator NreC
MNRIRVLLAEDHETVRQGLRMLLDAQPDIEVVGEAADGRLAVERARSLAPQVLVLDISMPVMNGLAAAKMIRETAPAVSIVALTRYDDDAYVKELLSVGVSGYVLKQSPSAELLRAIRAAARGTRHLDTVLAARTADTVRPRRSLVQPVRPPISAREATVLRRMALGHSNKEIADQMSISVKTVEVHKANAMRKLNLRGRIDVVRYAVLQGWLHEP